MWWQIFKRFWHCDKTKLSIQTQFKADIPDTKYTAEICNTIKLDDLYFSVYISKCWYTDGYSVYGYSIKFNDEEICIYGIKYLILFSLIEIVINYYNWKKEIIKKINQKKEYKKRLKEITNKIKEGE